MASWTGRGRGPSSRRPARRRACRAPRRRAIRRRGRGRARVTSRCTRRPHRAVSAPRAPTGRAPPRRGAGPPRRSVGPTRRSAARWEVPRRRGRAAAGRRASEGTGSTRRASRRRAVTPASAIPVSRPRRAACRPPRRCRARGARVAPHRAPATPHRRRAGGACGPRRARSSRPRTGRRGGARRGGSRTSPCRARRAASRRRHARRGRDGRRARRAAGHGVPTRRAPTRRARMHRARMHRARDRCDVPTSGRVARRRARGGRGGRDRSARGGQSGASGRARSRRREVGAGDARWMPSARAVTDATAREQCTRQSTNVTSTACGITPDSAPRRRNSRTASRPRSP